MSYIGRAPTDTGEFRLIDEISSSFDGSTQSFDLKVGTLAITPTKENIIIALDGVLQDPSSAYTVSGSTIKFSEGPVSDTTFYGVLTGQVGASIANSTITNDHVSGTAAIDQSKLNLSVGIVSASAQLATDISGSLGTNAALIRSLTGAAISGSIVGGVSGSAASTGSFGSIYVGKNVNATSFVGDGSSLTGIDIPTAADISGSIVGGVSGSVASTGSFGSIYTDKNVNASAFVGDGSALSGIDIPTAAAISGSHTSGFEFDGSISGSSTSTGSFGRVEATRLSGDGTGITGLSSFAGAAGTEALISGSSTSTGSFGSVHTAGYVGIGTASPTVPLTSTNTNATGVAFSLPHFTVQQKNYDWSGEPAGDGEWSDSDYKSIQAWNEYNGGFFTLYTKSGGGGTRSYGRSVQPFVMSGGGDNALSYTAWNATGFTQAKSGASPDPNWRLSGGYLQGRPAEHDWGSASGEATWYITCWGKCGTFQ